MDYTPPLALLSRPPGRPFQWVKPLVIGLVAIFGVGVLLILVARYSILLVARRSTAEIIARLDETDPGWRFAQIEAARKVIPEGENSAMLLMAANKLIPPNWPHLLATQVARPPAPVEDDPSRVIVPLIETDYFSPPDEKLIATLRAELDALGPVLSEARKVLDLSEGRYPLNPALNPLKTPLLDQFAARNTTRMLKLDAVLRIHDGDIPGALDSSRAMINIGRSLGDAPCLMSQLLRVVIVGAAIRSVERVLASGEPSDEALATVQALLEDEDENVQSAFLYGLRGERAMLNELFARLVSGELTKLDREDPPSAVEHWLFAEAMHTYAQGVVLEEMTKAMAIPKAKLSQMTWLVESWKKDVSKRFSASFWDRHACKQLPDPTLFVESYVASRARIRTAIIAIAAERYRRKNGRWPDVAQQLTPWPLACIPSDPYTDQPLLWLGFEADHSLVIYSPGPDLVDGAGALEQDPPPPPVPKGQHRQVKPYWEGKDIGFRLRDVTSRRPSLSPSTSPE